MNSNTTVRDIVSQIRGIYKLNSEDAFVTDRFLYSLFLKYGDLLVRRKSNEGKLNTNDTIFTWLPNVPLIEVDKIEAECIGIKTNCTFMRTKNKLPKMATNDLGSLVKLVMSLDTSEKVERTTLLKFHEMAKSVNFKYNKTKYFWEKNGYFYFPNVVWSGVTIQALFIDTVTGYCIEDEDDCDNNNDCNKKKKCKYRQDDLIPYSKDMVADIVGMISRDLGTRAQVPSDIQDNAQNIMR